MFYKIKNVFFTFLCLFVFYVLCEKYYKPITVLYSRLCLSGTYANSVGLVSKLN